MDALSSDEIVAVKSRLYPLTVWEQCAQWLLERLPRQRVTAAPRPVANVECGGGPGEFFASGPVQFELHLSDDLAGNWYYLEAVLVRHNGSREAWLVLDAEEGSHRIPIPSNLRGTIREVIYVPPGTSKLLWCPTQDPGYFTQSQLILHRITHFEARMRQAYRVIQDRSARNDGKAGPNFSWVSAIRDLPAAYRQSALERIRRYYPWDYAAYIRKTDAASALFTQVPRPHTSEAQFSLLMPIRSDDAPLLRDALSTLQAQACSAWELIVLHGRSVRGTEALGVIDQFARDDKRIRVIELRDSPSEPSDRAALLNEGLREARSELVACVEPRDRFAPDWLSRMAIERLTWPDAHFYYCDHDFISIDGVRSEPCFKPDWNAHLLESCDYIAGTGMFLQDRLLAAGGFSPAASGAELYDAALRYLHRARTIEVRHVPHVLVHRGEATHPGADDDDAAARVLQAHFDRIAPGAKVGPTRSPGVYRVHRRFPDPAPLVSVIVPTRDKVEFLRACVDGLRFRTDYPAWELLVMDNESSNPETLRLLQEIETDPRCRVIHHPGPFNYSEINNRAVSLVRGEFILLLNNDVEVIEPGWLGEMVSIGCKPGVGAVGAKLLYANGTVQHAGVILGMGGVAGHWQRFIRDEDPGYCGRAHAVQDISAVTGACLLVRREDYLRVGGLDEVHLQVAYNDVDLCLKLLAAGRRNVFTPHARLLHHESVSRGRDDSPVKRQRFAREFEHMRVKWTALLARDPAYNTNLSLDAEEVRLRT